MASEESDMCDVGHPRYGSAVLIDYKTLQTLFNELLHACPVTPGYFAPHVRYMCKRVGYACFTRRGLRHFAVDAFRIRDGDPESPRSMLLFRKMVPHFSGSFWDKCWDKNAREKYHVCAEHCTDEIKQSGSTHVYVDAYTETRNGNRFVGFHIV